MDQWIPIHQHQHQYQHQYHYCLLFLWTLLLSSTFSSLQTSFIAWAHELLVWKTKWWNSTKCNGSALVSVYKWFLTWASKSFGCIIGHMPSKICLPYVKSLILLVQRPLGKIDLLTIPNLYIYDLPRSLSLQSAVCRCCIPWTNIGTLMKFRSIVLGENDSVVWNVFAAGKQEWAGSLVLCFVLKNPYALGDLYFAFSLNSGTQHSVYRRERQSITHIS